MQTVLIVSETRNFLSISIRNQLEKAAYVIIDSPCDTDAIADIRETLNGIIILADMKMSGKEQQQALNYLKDRSLMDDVPIFVVGEPQETDIVKILIPQHLIRREFNRSVKVSETIETIGKFISQYKLQVKKKILLVDDSGAMLRSVKGWLEDRYNVSLANSGAMAIKNMTLNRPDLILLDYEMPIVDGKQVLEMIRAEMDFSEIPVIFLTAKSDAQSIISVKELKPEGYLLKSDEPASIVKAIDEFFDKQRALM